MRNLLSCFLIVFEIIASDCAQAQETFELSVTVPKEYDGADVTFTSWENSSFNTITTSVSDRKVILSGVTSQVYEKVSLNFRSVTQPSRSLSFFIWPASMQIDILSFTGNVEGNIRYTNVPLKDEELKLYRYLKPAADSSTKAYLLWEHATKGKWKGFNPDSLHAQYLLRKEREFERGVEFITQNPENYISLYFFANEIVKSSRFTADTLRALYSLFSKALQSTPLGQHVDNSIRNRKSLVFNKPAATFSFKTSEGEQIQLTSFRNKSYVLICFWASWCGPCKKDIPLVKRINEAYRDKGLQLISVSADTGVKNWFKAMEKHTMPWLQTCDLPEYIIGTPLNQLFQVYFIPQYFLIDKEGNLIYHNVMGKDDDNYSVLKQVLDEEMN